MMRDELPEDQRAAFRFKTRRWLTILIVAIAAYVVLWWFPNHQIQTEHDRAWACADKLEKTGVGDPRSCEANPWFARIVPWTRHDALAAGPKAKVAMLALELAARRDLDRAARDRAVHELEKEMPDSQNLWWRAGAFELLAQNASAIHDGFMLENTALAAMWTADVPALHVIADLHAAGDGADFARIAAKLQCLFGAPPDKIHAAITEASKAIDVEPMVGLRDLDRDHLGVVAALCDKRAHAAGPLTPVGWLELIGGWPAQEVPADAHPENRWQTIAEILNRQLTGDTNPEHYLDEVQLNWIETAADVLGEPETMLGPQAISPTKFDAAAQFLVGLADKTKQPNAVHTLRDNAYALALDAAAGWIRRGDRDKARASIAVATTLAKQSHGAGELRQVIPYLHANGDVAAAVELDASTPHARFQDGTADPGEAVEHALLLVASNQLPDAFTSLDVLKPQIEKLDTGHDRMIEAAAWLRVALALKLGRDVGMTIPTMRDAGSTETSAGNYYQLATKPAAEQAQARLLSSLRGIEGESVFGVALYVVGAGAGKGDAELWLDVVSADQFAHDIDPIVLASARAEAASWRGDAAAMKKWNDRLATIRGLAKDDITDRVIRTFVRD